MPLADYFLEIEKHFWTDGPEAYERYADAKCLIVFQEMAALLPVEQIAQSAEKGRWKDVFMQPAGTLELGDVTIVTYECRAMRKDGRPHKAIVSSGYVKRGEDWKLAFHQQTPLQT